MRIPITLLVVGLFATLGCGGSSSPSTEDVEPAASHEALPDDDAHAEAVDAAMGGAMHSGGGINAEVTLDPEIAGDWKAIRVRVVELESLEESFHEIVIGEEGPLGDTGLTLRAITFVPDFVMGEAGITSRSADPQNPAARVVIVEDGKDDYEGWLFGAMPEIHAYPHESYGVVLVEGIPVE
jgi:hypothetical protein